MDGVLAVTGQVLPYLFGGEREDRSEEGGEDLGDAKDHGLGGTPRGIFGEIAVQAVLVDVEVETRKIDGTEVDDPVRKGGQFIAQISLLGLLQEAFGGSQHEGVEAVKILRRDRVARRIEILQVPEEEAQRVADLAVGLGVTGHDLVRDPDVLTEIDHGRPQTENIRPVLLQYLAGCDDITQRLGHLVPLGVDHETVRHDLVIRRRPLERDRCHER